MTINLDNFHHADGLAYELAPTYFHSLLQFVVNKLQ